MVDLQRLQEEKMSCCIYQLVFHKDQRLCLHLFLVDFMVPWGLVTQTSEKCKQNKTMQQQQKPTRLIMPRFALDAENFKYL